MTNFLFFENLEYKSVILKKLQVPGNCDTCSNSGPDKKDGTNMTQFRVT